MFWCSEWPKRQVLNGLWVLGQASLARAPFLSHLEQNGKALRAVLSNEGCRFPESDRWFPEEVVKLVGHNPDHGDTFLSCIVLLVLDDIYNNGDRDQTTYLWMRNAAVLLDAPEVIWGPILRAIRHVVESLLPKHWNPYFD